VCVCVCVSGYVCLIESINANALTCVSLSAHDTYRMYVCVLGRTCTPMCTMDIPPRLVFGQGA
jgi:hypothetical protein